MATFKRFVIIVVFVLSIKAAVAQSSQIGWGLKGGMNSSGAQTDNTLVLLNQSKLGWQAGVYSKSIVEGWGYIIEANISALGSKQLAGNETQTNSIGYLTVPLAIQYRLPKKIAFYLGPYIGLRMWAQRKTTQPGIPDIKANVKDNVAYIDYGVHAGINYTFKKVLFDLRYLQGIQNFNTNSQINVRASNYSVQFAIGYFLK